MYVLLSASVTRAPEAFFIKSGLEPTALKALTGELTPPGISLVASLKSAADFLVPMLLLLLMLNCAGKRLSMYAIVSSVQSILTEPNFACQFLYPPCSRFFFFGFGRLSHKKQMLVILL
jgi:hypothetical protein